MIKNNIKSTFQKLIESRLIENVRPEYLMTI